MSNNYDITLTRGTDYRLFFDYLDENNNPVNLADATGKFTVKKYSSSGFTLIEAIKGKITTNFKVGSTSEYSYYSKNGGISFNCNESGVAGNTGGILVYIPKDVSQYIPEGRHLYNFELSVNDTTKLINGKFVCEENESLGEISPIEQQPVAWKMLTSYRKRIYGLRTDSKIVYWGNSTSYNDSTYTSGVLQGLTGEYIHGNEIGILAVLTGGIPGFTLMDESDSDPLNQIGLLPIPEGISHIKKIELGLEHAVALSENGDVFCWGANGHGQSTKPAGVCGAVDIGAGGYMSAAILSTGQVVAWGGSGGFGLPTDGSLAIAVNNRGITNAKQIALDEYSAYVLKADGRVVGITGNANPFGHNTGVGSSLFYFGFEKGRFRTTVGLTHGATLSDIVDIRGPGIRHYVARDKYGNAYSWGYNNYSTVGTCNSSVCAYTGYNNVLSLPLGITFSSIFPTTSVTMGLDKHGDLVIWSIYLTDPTGAHRVPSLDLE